MTEPSGVTRVVTSGVTRAVTRAVTSMGGALRRHRVAVAVAIVGVPVAVFGGVAVFGFVVWSRIGRVHVSFPGSPSGGTTYLLVGSDSRAFVRSASDRARFGAPTNVPGERADIMLLVRTLPGGGVRMLGIPRDLIVQLPDGSPTRMTLALLQGPQVLVDTVCQSLGIGIDHLIVIHFDGLRRVVDAVGGVDVRVPGPERDTVTGLAIYRAGLNRLDGQQALAYVRSRQLQRYAHGGWQAVPPSADARSDRAREVLAQIASRLHLSATSPFASVARLWAVSGAVTVDSHARAFKLRDLARSLAALAGAREADLPADFHPGSVPTADLLPSARAAVKTFQGGAQPGCSLRIVHAVTSPTAPDRAPTQPTGARP